MSVQAPMMEIAVGLGCRRGVSSAVIASLVREALASVEQQGAAALCFAVPNLHSLLPRLLNECGAELEGGVEFDAQRGAVATVKHGGVFFTLTEEDG
jgi:hypothetical protein